MARKSAFIILLICFIISGTYAGGKDSTGVSKNRYSLAVGGGWTHYINTLEIGKDQARTNSAGLSLKFYWEPEHRLSLGLESGFYRLYKVKGEYNGQVTMSAIPLLLNVRMRIVDHFYLSAGTGLALMFNKVKGVDQDLSNTILSLSNYQFTASYLYPLSDHWHAGGELRVVNFGKSADWIYTLQATVAVKL